jgi:hypothetical protein
LVDFENFLATIIIVPWPYMVPKPQINHKERHELARIKHKMNALEIRSFGVVSLAQIVQFISLQPLALQRTDVLSKHKTALKTASKCLIYHAISNYPNFW